MKKSFLLLIALVLTGVMTVGAQTFSQVTSTLNLGSVLYMTNGSADSDGVLFDQKVIDDLTEAGYDLTQGYPGEGGVISVPELNAYDLVVIGRNTGSGDFKLKDDWAEVEAPVLTLSGYIVRNSRLNIVNSGSLKREVDSAMISNKDRITKAKISNADDFVFNGIPVVDGKMDYMTWFYDYLLVNVDTFEATSNGKVLASIVDAENSTAEGCVLMARWEAGKETYEGSGTTPKGYRSYMQIGADDKVTPKTINYAQYTDASFQLLCNEMNFLIHTSKDVQYFVNEGNVDADSKLLDQQVLDDLAAAGYTNVTKTYPGEAGAISPVELSQSDLIVVGRNVGSGDFKLKDDWAKIEAPVLFLSGYIVRNSRLNIVNSGSLKREVDSASVDNKDRITKALIAEAADPAFTGVKMDGGKMDYMTWFYDYLLVNVDTFNATSNGKILASIVDAEKSAAEGCVLMARWEAGVETYEGSGTTSAGYRSYLQMGADDKATPVKNYNYSQYTDASFKLLINEMSYLTSTYSAPTVEISKDATLASITVSAGTLTPDFAADNLNYTVELAEGTTEVPTVTAVAINEFATVEQTDAETVPGNTVIRVTAQDEATLITYIVSFTVAGGDPEDVVEPGTGTLDLAVMSATDGDTLILANGGQYDILSPLAIDKKLTIIAEEIPALPALENMPIISNMFLSTQVFGLKTNCDLTLIGINVDALGGSFIFDPMQDSNQVVNLYVNRCRLHNTTNDIFNDDGSATNNITLGKLWVRNTFVYDNGSGHGFYTKNMVSNGSDWKFENITMWNLGQQFNWARALGGDQTQKIVYDHITGHNLSTSSDNKELFGNDEKTGGADELPAKANMAIEFKNNIMSTQGGTNEASLIFKNTDGNHEVTINNNVLFAVKPMANLGTITEADNMIDVDPQFADADNLDFTIGNADLYTAADDGKIIGAVYWHPDFVDDFNDVTSIKDLKGSNAALAVSVYPNPFNNEIKFSTELTTKGELTLRILNVNGQEVSRVALGTVNAGMHSFTHNTSDLKSGIYLYQLISKDLVGTGKIVKQ
ncbi:MAG: T9SS type A sorting domain-containing protein [Salinivirgaceae bacterium]|jgi:hypothetical protein|nr:T9SS type A sorting domain-containing protein [Salinivirgaceae bacterium]